MVQEVSSCRPGNGGAFDALYPNSLPGGIPARLFGRHNAEEALTWAREAVDLVAGQLGLDL